MNGQWVGRYNGFPTSGLLVVDLDDMGTHYEGPACAYDDNALLPSTFTHIRTPNKGSSFELTVDLLPIDPSTGSLTTWDNLAPKFPASFAFPKQAKVNFGLYDQTLKIDWRTDINTAGNAAVSISKSRAGELTDYAPLPNVTTWKEFKTYVESLEPRRFIFRGQKETKRLRTCFHRTGRADLGRFQATDIQTLHRHLSVRTSHIFNLNLPDENGAFYNLVQHHGYPTPLLDWTYSPFVGAFFAYRHVTNSEAASIEATGKKVRIFVFDQMQWRTDFPQIPRVMPPCRPHFSIMEFIAIDNERLTPQQSISSVTNIDDIETYIRSCEENRNRQYLQIIDLPLGDRSSVMRELGVMGITAGSLFPGLDGACEELKERFFPCG